MAEHSTTDSPRPATATTGWRALAVDFVRMIRFHSRLPAPRLPFEADAHEPPDFARGPRALPLAGLVIGLPSAAALWVLGLLGLPELVAAAAAVAVMTFATGAFHEDGLADTFDGLAGGWTPERRLEIMKDSRIGSFGASALALGLILRTACLAGVAERADAGAAALALLAAASVSRVIGLTPLTLLPPARATGFSSTVGRPANGSIALALGLSTVASGALLSLGGLPLASGAVGAGLGVVLALAMTGWARRAIGGQTGDIAGACQQLAEIAFYVGLLMFLAHE